MSAFFRYGNTLNITQALIEATGPSWYERASRDKAICHLCAVMNWKVSELHWLRDKWTSCQINALVTLAMMGRKIEHKDQQFIIS